MRSLCRFAIAVLVGLAACMQVFPVWAVGVGVEARSLTRISPADLAAFPSVGELQVGDRVVSLERVKNGFVARDLDTGDSVVITDEALQHYMVAMPGASSDRARRVTVLRQQLFGGEETLSVEIDEASDAVFAGTVIHGETRLPVVYRPADPGSLAMDGLGDSGELRRESGEALVIVVVLSAAAIAAALGAIGCAVATLWTNCIDDCGDACSQGGGSMESASEGWCGECTCECQTDPLFAS